MSSQLKPFRPRRTRLRQVREIRGWRMKIYGIVYDQGELSDEIVDGAIAHAASHAPWPQSPQWKFGFLTIHQGEQAVWLLVDTWAEDILRQFLFHAPLTSPQRFSPGPDDGTTACVWELDVIRHERDAWVRHVLATPDSPNFAAWERDCLQVN